MREMPNLPTAACCSPDSGAGCICGDSERVLRAVRRGDLALSDDQREWCRKEIARVEGYSCSDYEGVDDVTLAIGVLSAWIDYCRDKGLL